MNKHIISEIRSKRIFLRQHVSKTGLLEVKVGQCWQSYNRRWTRARSKQVYVEHSSQIRFPSLLSDFHVRQLVRQEAQLMLAHPRDAYWGQSRSPNMVPFDMSGMVSYYNPKVTLSIRRAVFQIFDSKNVMTLKSRSEVTQGHRNRHG